MSADYRHVLYMDRLLFKENWPPVHSNGTFALSERLPCRLSTSRYLMLPSACETGDIVFEYDGPEKAIETEGRRDAMFIS